MNKQSIIDSNKRYEKKRISKRVSFNISDSNEAELLNVANSLNFSVWVKEKLHSDFINKNNLKKN